MPDRPETTLPSTGRIRRACLAGGFALSLLGFFMVPLGNFAMFACPFHEMTGLSCLTCGLTRSLHAMAHGQLVASLEYHLMGPIIFTGMLLSFIRWTLEAAMGRRLVIRWTITARRRAIVVFIMVWILFWGLRLATEAARLSAS